MWPGGQEGRKGRMCRVLFLLRCLTGYLSGLIEAGCGKNKRAGRAEGWKLLKWQAGEETG